MGTLNEFQAQAVVDGILEGYKNYLDERRQKKEELRVSAGYAFTKGNHIDDTIAKKLQGLIEEDTLQKQVSHGSTCNLRFLRMAIHVYSL
ncbi:hypothetical protein [Listeria booriae]|uniref:hypothetical protein n=1 Tax=Listeria booriae TaxID=1552123 RepID=UPI001629180E|nr:hypothetical protein [Listeria booriae]MBC2673715.1 hypothetical protein [Listeria booriae]